MSCKVLYLQQENYLLFFQSSTFNLGQLEAFEHQLIPFHFNEMNSRTQQAIDALSSKDYVKQLCWGVAEFLVFCPREIRFKAQNILFIFIQFNVLYLPSIFLGSLVNNAARCLLSSDSIMMTAKSYAIHDSLIIQEVNAQWTCSGSSLSNISEMILHN